jgi:hemerythrin
MDDQHGILMDAINELRLALVRGAGQERISELLDEFIEFTRMHFWSEEQLMEQTGYAELAEHRAEHHRILADILQSAHRLQYGEGVELRTLLCSLHHGFLDHVEAMDQKYTPWFQQHGVC